MLRADGAAEIAGTARACRTPDAHMSRRAALGAKSSLETAPVEEIVHTVPTEALAKPDLVTSRVRGPGCGAYLLAELAELCVRRAARRCKIAAG